MRKVTDLIIDALKDEEDYKFKINMLIASLLSPSAEEDNLTLEKEKQSQEWLKEILEFAESYEGDKKEYIDYIANKVRDLIHD